MSNEKNAVCAPEYGSGVCRTALEPGSPSPSDSGRCSVVPGNGSICRHFAGGTANSDSVPAYREVLCDAC